jgi:hypothetical protein
LLKRKDQVTLRVVLDEAELKVLDEVGVGETEISLHVGVGLCLGGGDVLEGASCSICPQLEGITDSIGLVDSDVLANEG